MFRVLSCLGGEHDVRLVLLAGVICFLASTTAINLVRRALATQARARTIWLALAGAAAGGGIWATHFIAMLAYDPGISIAYNIGLTALSLMAAITITGVGLATAVMGPEKWRPLLGGGIVGAGVACMHYTGMFALELPGHVTWSADLVVTSIVAGGGLAMAALWIGVRRHDLRGMLTASVLLTLAIVSHHFTAMGAVEIVPDPARVFAGFSLSPLALAAAVASVAVAVLGITLLGAIADERLRDRDLRLASAVNNMSIGVVMFDDERLVVC